MENHIEKKPQDKFSHLIIPVEIELPKPDDRKFENTKVERP